MARVKKNRNKPMDVKDLNTKNEQVVCTFNDDGQPTYKNKSDDTKGKSYYGKNESSIRKIIADNIMWLRKTYNLSQHDFAKLINFSVGTISGVETTKNMPSIYFIQKISQVFNIPMDSLLSEQGIACYYKIQVRYDSCNPISTVFPFRFSEEEQRLMVQLHFVGNENRRKIKEQVLQMLLEKVDKTN